MKFLQTSRISKQNSIRKNVCTARRLWRILQLASCVARQCVGWTGTGETSSKLSAELEPKDSKMRMKDCSLGMQDCMKEELRLICIPHQEISLWCRMELQQFMIPHIATSMVSWCLRQKRNTTSSKLTLREEESSPWTSWRKSSWTSKSETKFFKWEQIQTLNTKSTERTCFDFI